MYLFCTGKFNLFKKAKNIRFEVSLMIIGRVNRKEKKFSKKVLNDTIKITQRLDICNRRVQRIPGLSAGRFDIDFLVENFQSA